MSSEHPHPPTQEDKDTQRKRVIERWIRMAVYNHWRIKDSLQGDAGDRLREEAAAIPERCIQIMTDSIIQVEKATNIDDLSRLATEIDLLKKNRNKEYEQKIRHRYTFPILDMYTEEKKKAIKRERMKYLKDQVVYDLVVNRITNASEKKELTIDSLKIKPLGAICQNVESQLQSTIVPRPEYL